MKICLIDGLRVGVGYSNFFTSLLNGKGILVDEPDQLSSLLVGNSDVLLHHSTFYCQEARGAPFKIERGFINNFNLSIL